ncbi:MAG TPA: NADH:ubiquinone reductase (Na(+)-transporting) subunit C [Desulfosalsimonadaceae bacterium]|nr:NADH:ubiquinone reductase (Na(+)-transporting) subunit C [Desulfosalsimonadaceae bacterium]
MPDQLKSIGFALAMCFVCGVLLTTAATALQEIQQKNMLNDRRKNILRSVDLISREKAYTPDEIARIYRENISKMAVGADGTIVSPDLAGPDKNLLPLYLFTENQNIQSYIIPIESQGLWGKIYAYMALENDGSTIAGFTVYKHSETPGLGGEIDTQWFQEKFEGKKIIDQTGNFVAVAIAKGEAEKKVPDQKLPHYVDGISGATLTGKYLTQGLQKTLSEYEPVSVAFRKNRLRCRMQEEQPWCETDETDQN